jgi:hypothetical protein
VCFVFSSEQTANYALQNIKLFFFITEMNSVYSAVRNGYFNKAVCASSVKGFVTDMKSVYSAVRTGYLNKAVCASSVEGFYKQDEKCLQRGTEMVFK